jgi:pimeloyl-ACP methyl ester carboxylesterase
MRAFDALVAGTGSSSAAGATASDRDALLALTFDSLYVKDCWSALGFVLSLFEQGSRSGLAALAGGCGSAPSDAYFAINAVEQRYSATPGELRALGDQAFESFPHFWWNSGYSELPFAFFPAELRARDAFYGPFRAAPRARPVLVVATTYDPAAPYAGAQRLVRELGNARLLTLAGDGHTAYGQGNPCIDAAVNAYLTVGTLPAPGASCEQGAALSEGSE